MPDYLKISELPAASSVAPTDQVELNQSGTSRSATIGLAVGVYQTVSFQAGAVATGTTLVPFDDTIPQITEGDQYMALAITPRSATSRLIIRVEAVVSSSVINSFAAALFRDATANALAVSAATQGSGTGYTILSLAHSMISGTTSATTFRVRIGGGAAGTTTFNGSGGARTFGGAMASSIVIHEVAA